MNKEKNKVIESNFKLNLIIDGILVGIFSGGLSLIYRLIIGKTDTIRHFIFEEIYKGKLLFIIPLFILASIIISLLLKWAPLSGGSGIPQIQGEILGKFNMNPIRVLISKFIGGSLANTMGMSLGREGPSIQIGGAMAKIIAKILKRGPRESKYIITAGTSAGLSAAFNAPIAGAIFSLEEMHKSFSHYLMIPAITASVIANYISFNVLGMSNAFSFVVSENLPVKYIGYVAILGVITGVFGVIFNFGLVETQKLYGRFNFPLWIKISFAALITIPFGLYSLDLLGGGHHLAEDLANLNHSTKLLVILLILKLVFTWISYGSGTQGGIFLPVLVIGCILGVLSFSILNNFTALEGYHVNFMILGMAGILTAVVRAPILSILLVTEMTMSFSHLISITFVSLVAFVVAELLKNPPIYESLLEGLFKKFNVEESTPSNNYLVWEYALNNFSACINKELKDIDWPCHLIIVSVKRGDVKIVPNSLTILEPGDQIEVLCSEDDLFKVNEYFKSSHLE